MIEKGEIHMKIAYLGPEDSYSHLAAETFFFFF